MRAILILCVFSLPASAADAVFRCIDQQGVTVLTDRPCDTLPNTVRAPLAKEHFALPPSELNRSRWVHKTVTTLPPKVDVETLRMARQVLELRDKVASAR